MTKKNMEIFNQIKSKYLLDNLKNDYFLNKIFNNLQKKKSLEIIKYNNKTKKRLNITVNNYKDYNETYSSIELEILPSNKEYGQFIRIEDEEEKYFHIYFNDNRKEIKRCYVKERDNVQKINIIIDYQITSFEKLFYCCDCIESIKFKKFYRNNINNMRWMFYGCRLLQKINLFSFNTKSVIDMSGMFYECISLKEIDLSNFNINNVQDMGEMFSNCSSLKEINLSNFNINNITYVGGMFHLCSNEIKKRIKSQIKDIKEIAFE